MSKHSLDSVLHYIRRIAGPGEAADADLLDQFASSGDEAAFQKLVMLHGPMVLALCRRLLRHEQDAEDAFQATFLTLARKAGTISNKESLAGWLYKVAYRVSCRVRATVPVLTNRMDDLDRPASEMDVDMIWRDLRFVLDEEISRLSEHYRRPIVLCYLQGNTNEEAALLLGCPKGTVATRLARAREQLRRRLTRRGCVLSAGILTTVLTTKASAVSLPAGLVRSTLAYASGKAILSGKVLALSDGVLRMLYLNKMKMAAGVVLALVLAGTGVGLVVRHTWAGGGPENAGVAGTPKVEPAKAPPPAAQDEVQVAAKQDLAAGTDLFGDPLPARAVARLGTVRFRHGAPLSASAISPDCRLLAGGVSIDIQIWDAETGKTLQRISGTRSGGISALAFSPDSKLLAGFGTRVPKLLICDVATGKIVKQFDMKLDDRGDSKQFELKPAPIGKGKVGQMRIPYLVFVPGGNTLLLTDGGPTVRLYDVVGGEEVRAFRTRAQSGPSIAIASNGQTFAAMDDDGTVRLWEVATGKEQLAIEKHKVATAAKRGPGPGYSGPFPYVRMVFAPDGKVLATGNQEGVIFLWDAATGKLLLSMEARDAKSLGAVASLSFSPDGNSLVSSHRNVMVVWDPSTGKEVRRLDYPGYSAKAEVLPAPFSPDAKSQINAIMVKTSREFLPATFLSDGKTLLVRGAVYPVMMASARNEITFSFVDVTTGKPCRFFDGPLSDISDIVYSRDGLHVATAEKETSGMIRVWDTKSGRLVFQAGDQQRGSQNALAFNPKGNILVAAYSSEIVFWEVKTGKVSRTFAAKGPITLAMAPDGKKLVSCDEDRTIRIRDLTNGKELLNFRAGENNPKAQVRFSRRDIAFSSDLRLAATAETSSPDPEQALIQIWDLSTGKEWKRFGRGGRGAIQLAFSPDGRTLLETTGTKSMYLWEVASGEQRQAVAMARFAYSAAYSPDNRHIALGERDQRTLLGPKAAGFEIPIHIYDVASNRFVSTLHGHEGTVTSLSFSLDGRFLASGSTDMTGLVWNMATISGSIAPIWLTAKERSACWADLAGTAKDAFSSMWKLVADKEAVNFLRENLPPAAAPVSHKEIQKLVADLASDQVAVRTQAAKEMTKIGPPAEEELRKALIPGLPLETHRRVEEVLRALVSQQLRSVRAIEVLESINTQATRQLLEALAKGHEGVWQTREAKISLERMANRPVP
jgi:RNA polymerase sigma factor (sigma-70 family)